MSFEKAGDFLFLAAQKYKLGHQAQASLVCERMRSFFVSEFPEFAEVWLPDKFRDGVLFVRVQNSAAASALFLKTYEILEVVRNMDWPDNVCIDEIRIVRGIQR